MTVKVDVEGQLELSEPDVVEAPESTEGATEAANGSETDVAQDEVQTVSIAPTRIPVAQAQPLRSGVPTVVGSISVAELAPRHAVAVRDFFKNVGYQRDPITSRVTQLAGDLERGRVDLPTAILANIRDDEFDGVRMLVHDSGTLFLDLMTQRLWLVDGQHRVAALLRCFRDNPEKWGSYRLSATIMLGATEKQEMEQFYVVNSTAKSVRTDLALDLLKHRTENDPGLWAQLDERGETWKVEGQSLTEEMAKTPIWKGRIRFPGAPKADTLIGSAGMVGSLRPVLQMSYFQMLSQPRQVSVIDAYWQGIREVLPAVFFEPEQYTMMKSTGVITMHAILVPVLEVASRGRSDTDPQVYADILGEALTELEGTNAGGQVVRGADFWLAGADGAAGSFSSNAGRRVLLAMIRRNLPRIAGTR